MKYLLVFLLISPLCAQDNMNNEIFLFNISVQNDSIDIKQGINISKNRGYDNQPFFYSPDTLVYSGTQNNQTDIAAYSIVNSNQFWLSKTGMGSEYSPQRIPASRDVAAVRLDSTGLQLLYRYKYPTGESEVLLPDLKVGYFFFYDKTTLITAVLSGTGMDLVINDLNSASSEILIKNIGRSIHKVPHSNYMSYNIRNEQNDMDLYLLDLKTEERESFFLCTLPAGVQDYAWLDQNRIIIGKGTEILIYDMLGESEWQTITDLAEYGFKNITRIAVNDTGNKIALAAEINEAEND